MNKINLSGFTNLQECLEKALPAREGEVRDYKDGKYKFTEGHWKKIKEEMKTHFVNETKKVLEVSHGFMLKSSEGWANALTEAEYNTLASYRMGDFAKINNRLRFGEGKVNKIIIDRMTQALNKYTLPQDTLLHRTTHMSLLKRFGLGDNISQWVGKSFIDKGFVSTSIGKYQFSGDVIMDITVPTGTHGGYLPSIWKDIGQVEGGEFLLQRGYTYEITRVIQKGDKWVVNTIIKKVKDLN